MSEGHPEAGWPPHGPAPPESRQLIPEWPMLWRGLGLAGLTLGLLWAALQGIRASWLLAPVTLVLAIGGVLAAWAAAIHLTGGEKFDDHPWV
ncbi:MAG: hypothetical protein ACM3S1_14435 [Hyphomicrobiales bacterium]